MVLALFVATVADGSKLFYANVFFPFIKARAAVNLLLSDNERNKGRSSIVRREWRVHFFLSLTLRPRACRRARRCPLEENDVSFRDAIRSLDQQPSHMLRIFLQDADASRVPLTRGPRPCDVTPEGAPACVLRSHADT